MQSAANRLSSSTLRALGLTITIGSSSDVRVERRRHVGGAIRHGLSGRATPQVSRTVRPPTERDAVVDMKSNVFIAWEYRRQLVASHLPHLANLKCAGR